MYFGMGEGELCCEEGDTVDVLFNIDINDYKNVRSVQMILHDIRICEEYKSRLTDCKARYEEIRAGGKYELAEQVLPSRDDFAHVYTALRKEFRGGTSVLDCRSILKLVNSPDGQHINYIKLKFILRILNELQICEINEIEEDIYRFNIFFNASKTSIEKSSILKKLRGQCADRNAN